MLFEPEIQKWGKIFIFVLRKYFLAHMLEAWKYKFTIRLSIQLVPLVNRKIWRENILYFFTVSSLNTLPKNYSNYKKYSEMDK